MAVDRLPEALEKTQEDPVLQRTPSGNETSREDLGVSSLRVTASAVERVAGEPGNQTEASTSGGGIGAAILRSIETKTNLINFQENTYSTNESLQAQ